MNGVYGGDRCQRLGIRPRRDQVAFRDELAPDPSGDRRLYPGEAQVQLGHVESRLRRLNIGLRLQERLLTLLEGRGGDVAALPQLLASGELGPRQIDARARDLELRTDFIDIRLVGARIDDEKQVADPDERAFR